MGLGFNKDRGRVLEFKKLKLLVVVIKQGSDTNKTFMASLHEVFFSQAKEQIK